MKKAYEVDRAINLKEIAARHVYREIEGCNSWRHYAVHLDRAWLLSALEKIQAQVEKVRLARGGSVEETAYAAELDALLEMFEEGNLNQVGDTDK